MRDLELNFICTYKLLVEDDVDDEGMRELLYQMQLLQMFKLDNFNEEAINDKIDKLFDEVKELDFIKNILTNNPYKLNFFNNDALLFRTFFSFDFLDLFHKCLQLHFNNLPTDDSVKALIQEFTSK